MRQVKHVFLQALWQPRQDTNQGNWLVPAQPHVQLSPTFSCHMRQTAACRKQALFCHANIIWISVFFTIWWFFCAFGDLSLTTLSTLSSRAFDLTLMASDKCSYWLQECLTLIGFPPMVSYLVCLLFYKCHCHILLNLCMYFPPLTTLSALQVYRTAMSIFKVFV